MTKAIEYLSNSGSEVELAEHLTRCDADFIPRLSARVVISDYAQKLADSAVRFEAWSDDTLVGLVAAYCNDIEEGIAFITSVSVLRGWMGKGIGARLVEECIAHAAALGMRQVALEVSSENQSAIRLYEKRGFSVSGECSLGIQMSLNFEGGE